MTKKIFALLIFAKYLIAIHLQTFIEAPFRPDRKIDIPAAVKHVKIDIGLSYSAPMSQHWLSEEEDLWVFGFEPDINSIQNIKKGAVKLDSAHGIPLDPSFVGKKFFPIPCALGLSSGTFVDFYVTKESCGCSSLYVPKCFEIKEVVKVPVFCLSDFFDLFPFDTHPVIDYIKIDAQGSDLDIAKSAGQYLAERVIYITIEAENNQYENTINSETDIDRYMKGIGFERFHTNDTGDPTYFNPRFLNYIKTNKIKIFQRG